jgi:membrane protein DedA with SNARE-associated domain
MNLPWFKRIGIFFIPITIIGWLIFSGGLIYAVYIFIDTDSRSHSASDTLINFFFNLLLIGAVYSLIGYLTSRRYKS